MMEQNFATKIKSNFITRLCLAYIFLTSGLIVNFLQLLVLPLWYLNYRTTYRYLICKLNYLSWCLVPGIAQWWAGVEVYMYARPEDFKAFGREKTICVLNHKAQMDWVISWIVSDYCNILGNAKCMVKQSLRYVPILGWGFWFGEYIFLKRKIEHDRITLDNGFKALSCFVENFWMLIFCEGTRFTPEKHKRSVEFALKNGLKPLKHHLTPRTKGFHLVSEGLRDTADTLYDATVNFRGEEPTFQDMIEGKPCVADFFIRRLPISDIPSNEIECAQYVHDIYQEKDVICEYFQEHQTYPIGDANFKYKDFVKRKIHKNPITLVIMVFWTLVTMIPLLYYIYATLVSGSSTQIAILAGLIGLVGAIFYLMLEATKPQSDYGK